MFSIHSHAMEDLDALVQGRFQGRVPSHLLPSRFAGYERIAANIRLLGGKSVLEPSSKGMVRYPMPQPAIMLSDIVFGTPLVPRNAADALLFFLFPYPNIFQATSLGSDPISRLEPKTLGQLTRLCGEYAEKLETTCLDAQVMALEEDFTKALLKALNFDAKKYERLEPKLDAFNRWITVQAFARKIDTMVETATPDDREFNALKHPDLTLPQCGLRDMFRGSQEFWGISCIELDTLRHSSNEHPKVLQSFAENVLNEASASFSTFENRVKDFGKMRLINLMVRGMVDHHYGADMNGLNLQSRLALFFWKKYQWALQEGNTTPIMAFYAHNLGIAPIEEPMNIVLFPSPPLTFDDIERDPRQFFLLSLPAQEKIIKECAGAFIPINMHQGKVEDKTFSDCMETAIFNLVTALIHRVEEGKVILDSSSLPDCPLKTYLITNPVDFHEYKHSEWANAVAGIPSVKYLKTTKSRQGCEVRPGLISTLNVLSFLLSIKDPIPHEASSLSLIEKRLGEISTMLQEIGYPITLILKTESSPQWSPSRYDYGGIISLKKGEDYGICHICHNHGELTWVTGNSNRVIPFFDHAQTPEKLLTAAPLVKTPRAFIVYMNKLRMLGGTEHLKTHLFQMDLTSLDIQSGVFGEVYTQPSFQSFSLSIAQRLSNNAFTVLQAFRFETPIPSDDFLASLATVCPGLLNGNSFTDENGSMRNFILWCLSNGKDKIIEDNLDSITSLIDSYLPASHKSPEKIASYLRKMPNLENLNLFTMTGSFEDQKPVLDFLCCHPNKLSDLRDISLSYDYVMSLLDNSPLLYILYFSTVEDGSWTTNTMRTFVHKFLTRNSYGKEKNLLIVANSFDDTAIQEVLRSVDPHYLREGFRIAGKDNEWDHYHNLRESILKEIEEREAAAAVSAEGKTDD